MKTKINILCFLMDIELFQTNQQCVWVGVWVFVCMCVWVCGGGGEGGEKKRGGKEKKAWYNKTYGEMESPWQHPPSHLKKLVM